MIKVQPHGKTLHPSLKTVFNSLFATTILSTVPSLSYANDNLTHAGDALQIAIPLGAAAISIAKNDYEGLGQHIEGIIWTSVATHSLKYAIDERRPNGADDNSFPSGHTSAAFQGATYLQARYGLAYGAPAYLLASVVGYSRVESKNHYWKDVIAGAALGSGIQFAISELGWSATNWVITPMVTDESIGVYASLNY